MNKNITVKGMGRVSAKPDFIELNIKLAAKETKYDNTLALAETMLNELKDIVKNVGFERGDLKTSSFTVDAYYENEHDARGNYKRIFKGFECRHDLKLSFDLDMVRLSKLFNLLASAVAAPQFSVNFTVKDKEALKEEMLKSATEDAKRKAEILTKAAGVMLGELISIDYSFADISLNSPSVLRAPVMLADNAFSARQIDIEPEEIKAEETVTFTWAI